ncbi:MAG: hypothetical protein ACHP83_16010, partial [Burkholderiales bacterium]
MLGPCVAPVSVVAAFATLAAAAPRIVTSRFTPAVALATARLATARLATARLATARLATARLAT